MANELDQAINNYYSSTDSSSEIKKKPILPLTRADALGPYPDGSTAYDERKSLPQLKPLQAKEDLSKPVAQVQPTQRVAGRIEFTPEMEKRDEETTKSVLPQPGDSPATRTIKAVTFPVNAGIQGLESVPESLTNAALGVGQSLANVPIPQRKTFGDVMRTFGKDYISPSEWDMAPHFQSALAQHPAYKATYEPSQFLGGWAFPLGGVESAIIKPFMNVAKGAIPAIKMGNEAVQIARNANPAKIMNLLGYKPRLNPILSGMAAGAAYTPIFASGNRFAQTRQLPQAPELATETGLGAAGGMVLGHAVNQLQRLFTAGLIKKLASQSALEKMPEAEQSVLNQPIAPDENQMRLGLSILQNKNLARNVTPGGQNRSFAHKDRVQKRIFDYAANKFVNPSAEHSQEHEEALLKAINDWEKERLRHSRTQESRQYTEQKQQVNRAYQDLKREQARTYGEQKQQQNIGKTAQHTVKSGGLFEELSQRIQSAASRDELDAMRNEIFNTAPGPKGQPLLKSGQERELDRQWRDTYYNKFKEEGGEPGESKGTATGSTKVPAEQEPRDIEAPETIAPRAQNSTRQFILGTYRKTIDREKYGPRENRYKFAVSVEALAKSAGLSQEKTTALKKWVADASEIRRELTYKKMQLEQLIKWSYEHRDEWSSNQDKVKLSSAADGNGAAYDLLEHQEREGRYKTLALRAQMARFFEEQTESELEHVKMNMMRYGFEREGIPAEIGLKKLSDPSVRTTLNGKVENGAWQENLDGTLEAKEVKPLELGEFETPRSADDLFDRAENLKGWIAHFDHKLTDVYKANGHFNYLGDVRPVDVMQEAFDKLNLPILEKNNRAYSPNVHLWHIDSTGHVSTVRFDQMRTTSNFPDAMKDLEAKYKAVRKIALENRGKDGKINYDAIWADSRLMNELLHGFTGLEAVPVISMLIGKQLHRAASAVGRTRLGLLAPGTIDNILRSNEKFGGDEVSQALHGMLAQVNAEFFHDSVGKWHPVRTAEELSELLNEFKGVKVTRSNYVRHAIEEAKRLGNTTKAEIDHAIRRADTGYMIRAKYKKLAAEVQERIKEMDVRQIDARTGEITRDGRKFYTADDLTSDGKKVRPDAYNRPYHDALRELHKGLTLQSDTADGLATLIGDIVSRKSMSIMANNPAVALKNFFDQIPLTLAYYHKHFFTAAWDMTTGSIGQEEKEALGRLPVIPQADMNLVKLEERLKDTRAPENTPQWLALNYAKVNHWLLTKTDLLFGGKERLVSAADRLYTKISTLASLYKEAERREIPRHEFLEGLINKRFTAQQENQIFGQVSKDLTQVYNSVAPHLNKDIFAYSTVGRLASQYATPGRRAFRLMWDWMRSDDPADRLKFLGATAGLVALGGSGAVPQTWQYIMRLLGTVTGNSESAERAIDDLDQYNVLRKYTGIDYSPNFGPDIVTGARPAVEAYNKIPNAINSARNSKNIQEMGLKVLNASAMEAFSLFPKMGGFGYDVWMKLLRNVDAAHDGSRKIYFDYNGSLHSVTVYGYNYQDALRDWAIGGVNPKAFKLIQDSKINSARKSDIQYSSAKSPLPEKTTVGTESSGSFLDALPTKM